MRSQQALAAVAVLAAACAPVYEGQFAYDDGWRTGKVTEVGHGWAIHEPATHDCRKEMPARVVAQRSFARVTYSEARNINSMIVALDEEEEAGTKPGNEALVDTHDCRRTLKPAA